MTSARKRIARWQTKKGPVRTAEVLDDHHVQFVSDYWYIRYRDASGVMRRETTGCKDKLAAEKFLADVLAGVEKMKVGIFTPEEREVAANVDLPTETHVEMYLEHLARKRKRGRKVSAAYCVNTKSRINRVVTDCKFRRLRDITRDRMERWLDEAEALNLSAATRNEYLTSMSAFCNWASKNGRLPRNPLAGIEKADRGADRRHTRRALTADEVVTLLEATRLRPIAEVGRPSMRLPKDERRGRSSWTFEPLTAENFQQCYVTGLERLTKSGQTNRRKRLERLGRKRAMFYLLAVSTGFRHNEVSSLTVGHLHLDAAPPYLALDAADAKNGREAKLPLRPDVIEKIHEYLADYPGRAERLDAKLFDVPPTIRVFDADIQAAGITKLDARGRVIDIHGLRHTFGTYLSAAGVHPRTAMAAMRHSRIELTMNLYTDPALLDVAGAVNALPNFTAKPAPKLPPDTDAGAVAVPAA